MATETTYGEGGFCADCDPDAHGHPLHNVVSVEEVPDPPTDPQPDVTELATALAALPPDTLAALRAALGIA